MTDLTKIVTDLREAQQDYQSNELELARSQERGLNSTVTSLIKEESEVGIIGWTFGHSSALIREREAAELQLVKTHEVAEERAQNLRDSQRLTDQLEKKISEYDELQKTSGSLEEQQRLLREIGDLHQQAVTELATKVKLDTSSYQQALAAVNSSLQSIDKAFGYTETALEVTQDGCVVVMAVGVTALTGGGALIAISAGTAAGTGLAVVTNGAQAGMHVALGNKDATTAFNDALADTGHDALLAATSAAGSAFGAPGASKAAEALGVTRILTNVFGRSVAESIIQGAGMAYVGTGLQTAAQESFKSQTWQNGPISGITHVFVTSNIEGAKAAPLGAVFGFLASKGLFPNFKSDVTLVKAIPQRFLPEGIVSVDLKLGIKLPLLYSLFGLGADDSGRTTTTPQDTRTQSTPVSEKPALPNKPERGALPPKIETKKEAPVVTPEELPEQESVRRSPLTTPLIPPIATPTPQFPELEVLPEIEPAKPNPQPLPREKIRIVRASTPVVEEEEVSLNSTPKKPETGKSNVIARSDGDSTVSGGKGERSSKVNSNEREIRFKAHKSIAHKGRRSNSDELENTVEPVAIATDTLPLNVSLIKNHDREDRIFEANVIRRINELELKVQPKEKGAIERTSPVETPVVPVASNPIVQPVRPVIHNEPLAPTIVAIETTQPAASSVVSQIQENIIQQPQEVAQPGLQSEPAITAQVAREQIAESAQATIQTQPIQQTDEIKAPQATQVVLEQPIEQLVAAPAAQAVQQVALVQREAIAQPEPIIQPQESALPSAQQQPTAQVEQIVQGQTQEITPIATPTQLPNLISEAHLTSQEQHAVPLQEKTPIAEAVAPFVAVAAAEAEAGKQPVAEQILQSQAQETAPIAAPVAAATPISEATAAIQDAQAAPVREKAPIIEAAAPFVAIAATETTQLTSSEQRLESQAQQTTAQTAEEQKILPAEQHAKQGIAVEITPERVSQLLTELPLPTSDEVGPINREMLKRLFEDGNSSIPFRADIAQAIAEITREAKPLEVKLEERREASVVEAVAEKVEQKTEKVASRETSENNKESSRQAVQAPELETEIASTGTGSKRKKSGARKARSNEANPFSLVRSEIESVRRQRSTIEQMRVRMDIAMSNRQSKV